ncbi:putative Transmembrane protein [Cocos nucifera]|uniref:Putative Transmembrane protein n=1 Tax=Cocos nucifera TaxID=13894 RepID=A0A8K0MZA2_COCNU|nr:putative Transmembrane protein [Cocos nucifera]
MGTAVKGAGSACFHMLTGPAAGPLILACVCAALAYGTKRPGKRAAVLHRSLSIAALHGGEVALERILDAQEARVDEAALQSAADEMGKLLAADPPTISYRELHRVAAKLEMSGREDQAIEMLQNAVKEAEEKKQPHEAHMLEMVLVEMLIYKVPIHLTSPF